MKFAQIEGGIREMLMIVGSFLAGSGIVNSEAASASVGLIMCLISLSWSITQKEGLEKIWTLLRKTLSSVPGVLVAFSVITPDQAISFTSAIAPILALIWSFISNGGGSVPTGLAVFLIALGSLALNSCAGVQIEGKHRLPISETILSQDGISVDERTISSLAYKAIRLLKGEDFKQVVLPTLVIDKTSSK